MMRIAARLLVGGGREALVRLVLTATGVGLGVALLLFMLAGFNGLHAQDVRWGWLDTQPHNSQPNIDSATTDPLWWRFSTDRFSGQDIERVDVAATGPRSPVPPGIPRLPRAGEYYASPALAALLATTPRRELADRFPSHQVGIIGDSALTSPTALIVVVGMPTSVLANDLDASQVRSIETAPRETTYTAFLQAVLVIGAIALLFPILIFVSTATRIAAARREARFAALRLIGATPRQVSALAASEALGSSAAGVALGIVLFWVLRPLVAAIPFTGQPFFVSDLSVGLPEWAAIIVGVPLAAVAAALVTGRRVRISPLGVVRRTTPPAPRFLRVVPLLAGLGILAFFLGSAGDGSSKTGPTSTVALGFLVTLVGVVVAGPWITMVCTRALATRAGRVSSLIAARRLADDPARAFRSVSGIVVAVFAGSVFYGVAGTAIARGGLQAQPTYASAALIASPAHANALPPSQGVIDALDSTPGVIGAMPLYATTNSNGSDNGLFAGCPALDRVAVIGRCTTSGRVARVPIGFGGEPLGNLSQTTVWPSQPVSAQMLNANPLVLFVLTDGTTAALEQARTTVESAFGYASAPRTVAERHATDVHVFTELQSMVDVGTLLTLLIAGCSLAVAVATGLLERKRPFTLLRVTGVPLRELRSIVMLESAVPVLVMSLISALLGLLASNLILHALLRVSVATPSAAYYAVVACGVGGALAIVALTLPMLGRVTSPDTVRFE